MQYKRSDQLNNSIQKSINIGSKSRNGAVSRLRGKLDEAARINYRKNRGLHSSVLDTSNNNNNINSINNNNNLGARFRSGSHLNPVSRTRNARNAVGTGNSMSHLRSVKSSGYGVQNTSSRRPGVASASRGKTSSISGSTMSKNLSEAPAKRERNGW